MEVHRTFFAKRTLVCAFIAIATFITTSIVPNHSEEHPILAIWEANPFSNFVDCVTPTLVIYDNGLVIARHSWGDQNLCFGYTVLSSTELSQVSQATTLYFGGTEYEDHYDLTIATDQNTCTIFAFGNTQVASTSIYGGGLHSIQPVPPPQVLSITPELIDLPPSLAALVYKLKLVSLEATNEWIPHKFKREVRDFPLSPALPGQIVLSSARNIREELAETSFTQDITIRQPANIETRMRLEEIIRESAKESETSRRALFTPNKSL